MPGLLAAGGVFGARSTLLVYHPAQVQVPFSILVFNLHVPCSMFLTFRYRMVLYIQVRSGTAVFSSSTGSLRIMWMLFFDNNSRLAEMSINIFRFSGCSSMPHEVLSYTSIRNEVQA